MNFKVIFISCLSILTLLNSCIKSEGLEREADIISVSIEDEAYVLTTIHDDISKREVTIIIAGNTDKYKNGKITPKITVSKGATIFPASGETVELADYEHPYIVTAEDGGQKMYQIKVMSYQPLNQDFEEWDWKATNTRKPYEVPRDPMWDCGNSGIHILIKEGLAYPTRSSEDVRPGSNGHSSVLLETTEGNRNKISDLMDIPVFSGNMFRGKFVINMGDPLSSPNFGQPHPQYLGKPIALRAWYKYKAGSPYVSWEKVNGKKIVSLDENKKDELNLYAVLYKVTKDKKGDNFYLTGHNIKDFEQEIVVAHTPIRMPEQTEDEWHYYDVKFTHKEPLDFDKNNYKLAIILASSSEGANYMGAIGSRLQVDDLRVIFEYDKEAAEYK